MPKENDRHQGYDNAFFDQLFSQRINRIMDQDAAIIDRDYLDSFWQRFLDLGKLFLYSIDDLERVLAVAHYHNSANGLSHPVQVCDTSAEIWSEMNCCHLA